MRKLSVRYLRENRWMVLSALMLFTVHILLLVFINMRMPYLLDSDMSSEMILSKILKEENRIITDSWIYSTELRVLNTQLVYSFFFRFSDNWHTVRLLSAAVFHLILSLSTIYVCKRAGFGKYGFAVASFMLLSMTGSYFTLMVIGCYYVPHVSAGFINFGLCMAYMKQKGKKRYVILALASVLALLTGMGGLRQLVISYIPMLMCVCIPLFIMLFRDGWEKCKESYWFTLVPVTAAGFLMSGIGFLINSQVLSKKYYFMQYSDIKFTGLSIERTVRLFNDILLSFGYKPDRISVISLFSNCLCAVIIVLLVISIVCGLGKKAGREYRILTVFFLCSFAFFVLLYAMTDMSYASRYNCPVLVWAFPLIACMLREGNFGKAPKYTGRVITVLLTGMIFMRGFIFMNELKNLNKTGELMYVSEFLENSEYRNGYATFWNSNVITELTNGKTEMYSWRTSNDGQDMQNISSPDDLFHWLQKKEHETVHPEGKVFALYSTVETEYCNWKDKLRDEDLIYSTGSYRVYGYDSYDIMKSVLDMPS